MLYEAHHIYSLDGVRANHFLQHLRADAIVPVRGRLGVGVAGEVLLSQELLSGPGDDAADVSLPASARLLDLEPAMMVGPRVPRRALPMLAAAVLTLAAPRAVQAQDPPSRLWITAGAASARYAATARNANRTFPIATAAP